MKIYLKIIIAVLLFGVSAQAQTIVTLHDDSQQNRTLVIEANGHYEFRAAGVGSLLAAGDAGLIRRGCSFFLQDATRFFRINATGNTCDSTGQVTLSYFGFGTFTLMDRTKN